VYDNIITRYPVDWGGNSVLVASLEGIDNSEDLCRITSGRCRVGHDQSDGLFGVDDENRADGEGDTLLVNVGGILLIKHIVQQRNLSLLVANDWEFEVAATDFIYILDPTTMALYRVGGKTDELHPPSGELRLKFGERPELSGADWSVVFWV